MRRLFVLLILLLPSSVGAVTMCVKDRSFVVSLDSDEKLISTGYELSENIWWADYSYGRIYGESTCLSVAEGATSGPMTNAGLFGVDDAGADRFQCWCRMTHPAMSQWVHVRAHGNASLCRSNCHLDCANSTSGRAQIFNSVGL